MTAHIMETARLALRIVLMASVLMVPVAAFAYSQGDAGASASKGAGFVLYISLQRGGASF